MLDLEPLRLAIAALVLAMVLLFLALRRLTRHVHNGAPGGSTPLWLLALVFFMTIILMVGRPVAGNTYHGYFMLYWLLPDRLRRKHRPPQVPPELEARLLRRD